MIDTKALREKVLDLAIRGKLVPQDPTDEPASVLLGRIREQKKQMVKEGKLKAKDIKDDSIIFVGDDNLHYEKFADGSVKCIEDEIPFNIPNGWAWIRLQTVCQKEIKRGKAPKYAEKSGTLVFAQKCNTKNGMINISLAQYLDETNLHKYPIELFTQYGDIIINSTGTGTLGRVGIFEQKDDIEHLPIIPDSHITTVRVFPNIVKKYMYLFLKAYQPLFESSGEGSTNQKELRPDVIKSFIVAIPPFNEQKCIVEKFEAADEIIGQLDAYTDNIKDTISSVKSKILDLAIRGKLVSQNPDDEPASVLLERISAQKEELIKQGKIKCNKKESVIFKGEDNSYYRLTSDNKRNIIDIPFDIPDNWEWCNLSMIGSTNIGLTYKPADIAADGTMVLRSSNIVNGKIDLSDLVRVDSTIRENQYIQENDILICARNGSKALVGKCAIFENVNEKASFGAFMAVYRSRFFKYVYYFLNSEFFRNTFSNDDSKQINQLTQDMIKNTIIPLPPFAEQKRIVEAIETAFAQLDEITNAIS